MKRWRWTEVFYRGVALDVCIDCNNDDYVGNDICPIHSEEIITPILSTDALKDIYEMAIDKIKLRLGEQNDGS